MAFCISMIASLDYSKAFVGSSALPSQRVNSLGFSAGIVFHYNRSHARISSQKLHWSVRTSVLPDGASKQLRRYRGPIPLVPRRSTFCFRDLRLLSLRG